jgi:hypothetical protein
LIERRRGVLRLALFVPVVLVLLASIGHRADPTYAWFLGRFIFRLGGTPFYLALLAAAGFYTYATIRRMPLAFDALSLTFGALAFITPHTLGLSTLSAPRELPILAVAVAQTAVGLGRRSAARCLFGSACAIVSATIAVHSTRGMAGQEAAIVFHLALAALLAVGAAFDNKLGHLLRTAGATMALLGSLFVMSGQLERMAVIPAWAFDVYPVGMAVLLAGYGSAVDHRVSRAIAGLILAFWMAVMGFRGYISLRRAVAGLDFIAIGLLLFSLAVLTSMAKGGVLPWRSADRPGEAPDAPD